MNWDKAIEMLENGEGEMAILQVVLLKGRDGRIWMSFSGEEWEKTDSPMAMRAME
jgi:hypothetical protein